MDDPSATGSTAGTAHQHNALPQPLFLTFHNHPATKTYLNTERYLIVPWFQSQVVALEDVSPILQGEPWGHIQGAAALLPAQQHVRVLADDSCRVQGVVRGAPLVHLTQLQGWQAVVSRQRQACNFTREADDPVGGFVLGEPLGCFPVAVLLDAEVNVDGDLVHLHRDGHLAQQSQLNGQLSTHVDNSIWRVKMQSFQLGKGVHRQCNLLTWKD